MSHVLLMELFEGVVVGCLVPQAEDQSQEVLVLDRDHSVLLVVELSECIREGLLAKKETQKRQLRSLPVSKDQRSCIYRW